MKQRKGATTAQKKRLGEKIRARRQALGMLRLQDLGNRLRNTSGKPVAEVYVSRWERGEVEPSSYYRPKLAQALHMDEAELFAGFVGDPALSKDLEDRVRQLEVSLDTVVRLLDLDAAVDAAVARTQAEDGEARQTDHPIAREDAVHRQEKLAERSKPRKRPRKGRGKGNSAGGG